MIYTATVKKAALSCANNFRELMKVMDVTNYYDLSNFSPGPSAGETFSIQMIWTSTSNAANLGESSSIVLGCVVSSSKTDFTDKCFLLSNGTAWESWGFHIHVTG